MTKQELREAFGVAVLGSKFMETNPGWYRDNWDEMVAPHLPDTILDKDEQEFEGFWARTQGDSTQNISHKFWALNVWKAARGRK